MKEVFRKFSARVSQRTGSATAFVLAIMLVAIWAATGPMFGFSDTWQLVINTGTTIATFLMVFLIQNTQNRDTKAMQLRLDELIRSSRTARNTFLDLEAMTDADLADLENKFHKVHEAVSHPLLHKVHDLVAGEYERRRLSTKKST